MVTDDAGNDAIAIRPMMNITLTYDHRLVDGAYGAQFLKELRDKLESWDEGAYCALRKRTVGRWRAART